MPGGWAGRVWRAHTATPKLALLSAASVAVLAHAWWCAWTYHIGDAWFDIWLWVIDLQKWYDGSFTLHDLIKPHNEHPIATTRLLLLADAVWRRMDGGLVSAVSVAALGATGWLLAGFAQRGQPGVLPPLFFVALMSSVCQGMNLTLPFQVQFGLICLCAVGAARLLAAACQPGRARSRFCRALGAGVLCVLAAHSMASGMLLIAALGVMLLALRARWQVWAGFLPLGGAAAGWFVTHIEDKVAAPLPLLDAGLVPQRSLFVLNFLGNPLYEVAGAPVWFGGAVAIGFVGLAWLTLARRRRDGPEGVAQTSFLVALGIFVVACAVAGAFSARLVFGPTAALAERYTTMTLLLLAAMLSLAEHLAAAARPGAQRWAACAIALAAWPILAVTNIGGYGERMGRLQAAIAAQSALLANNVGVLGPAQETFVNNIDEIRPQIAFLHARRLNMFAPAAGARRVLLDRLAAGSRSDLPACRGAVDAAYRIDERGFLVRGWLAAPDGPRTADWVAAVDTAGHVLGSAPALDPRLDVARGLGARAAMGFATGFRLADGVAAGPVWLAGLFGDAPTPVCLLAQPVPLGAIMLEPMTVLRRVAGSPPAALTVAGGFTAGALPAAAAVPGGWTGLAGTDGTHAGEARFTLDWPAGMAGALALPFSTMGQAGATITVTLADGTVIREALAPLWPDAAWRAAVLPAGMIASHGGGRIAISVRAAGPGWLALAGPVVVTPAGEWARLF